MITRAIALGGFLLVAGCATPSPAPAPSPSPSPSEAPGRSATPAGQEQVDAARAKKLVAEGARLVDVRSPDEYAAKHIEGAENAPVETADTRDLGPKDSAIVLYCASGRRSARAAAALRARGYTRVYDLGAMSSWEK